jgi:glutathione S-transferase
MTELPILWSFRRCPYAMRARLAILASGQRVELREILLRDKPQAFLAASPSGTVPCLEAADGVVDESLDVMRWTLGRADPEGWLAMPDAGWDWIARCDGPFKDALDRTKYGARYPGEDPLAHRADAAQFLADLDGQLGAQLGGALFGAPSIADYAIVPFVRQFANIDRTWFDAQPWPNVQAWLAEFLASEPFAAIMGKYPAWQPGDDPVTFA